MMFQIWRKIQFKLRKKSSCIFQTGDLKIMYLKKFWAGIVLGIVIVLTFASFFIAKADWGKQGKENWFKVQHYDYA
jgi:hypothetical protein